MSGCVDIECGCGCSWLFVVKGGSGSKNTVSTPKILGKFRAQNSRVPLLICFWVVPWTDGYSKQFLQAMSVLDLYTKKLASIPAGKWSFCLSMSMLMIMGKFSISYCSGDCNGGAMRP